MKPIRSRFAAIVVILICSATAFAQVAGGPGVVVSTHDNGMVTVRIGDQEQTVSVPGAKIGDAVVCTAKTGDGEWECSIHKG